MRWLKALGKRLRARTALAEESSSPAQHRILWYGAGLVSTVAIALAAFFPLARIYGKERLDEAARRLGVKEREVATMRTLLAERELELATADRKSAGLEARLLNQEKELREGRLELRDLRVQVREGEMRAIRTGSACRTAVSAARRHVAAVWELAEAYVDAAQPSDPDEFPPGLGGIISGQRVQEAEETVEQTQAEFEDASRNCERILNFEG